MGLTPYFPEGLELEGYVPPVMKVEVIIVTFFSVAGAVLVTAWLSSKSLCTSERLIYGWMLVTGLCHMIVEGAWALNEKFYQNSNPNMLLLELWKEYSKADSRYATRDSFVVSMETFTAFVEGPVCFLVAIGLIRKASWRWPVLMLVSFGQLYGTILYFATCWLEGSVHLRPEPLYFWFYFMVMNNIWMIVPSLCIVYAVLRCNEAISQLDASTKFKQP